MTDPLTSCRVLLVDDEPANLDLLQAILEGEGITGIVQTDDAREAVPLVDAACPDLVLLDLHMPHRSGFEVLADLRAREGDHDFLPVLVLTADATFRAKEQALAGGATDFLTKPFSNAEVVLRVRNLLRTRLLYREQRDARRSAELLDEATAMLHASLDGDTAVARVACLMAERLAVGCAVDLRDDEGRLVRVAEYREPGGGAEVDTRGAMMVLPLRASTGDVGLLALSRGAPGAAFTAAEARLAEELARRVALAVEQARLFREARQAAEARERVLAVVAHDLRNPLCALKVDTELLRERADVSDRTPLERRVLARMHDTTARMDALIGDLLDVTRFGRGEPGLERAERDVARVVADAAEALRGFVASHDLALDLEIADAPVPAAVDAARVEQVVSNLVGNAVKFTAAGGRVAVGCAAVDGEARLTVRDTGVGIPAEQLPHVFGAFWQARHADRRGLGLGLAIARGIVEAHGGRIWVESRPGEGTTFTCAFPQRSEGPHA
ncbi:hybrid sensor histidine kinase/response regulator [Roseisolibacter sp. H3M3-2]|uniref:ATP-binding response regulator n=1 Tax=Roseisolibacter sp. H3M3-2 TaxID=3031323 RepID=UPI0023DAC6C5|nr:hybrid sensor histidine kinase/response regulator [Roseisolibacter sp. H3M3-2]MDF1502581.1 hybrid sensor histidine kinase/response regulator [Roseisolibacter sp. H3M3-2]